MKIKKYRWQSIALLLLFFQIGLFAQSGKITIEAASDDPTLVVRGKEFPVDQYTGGNVLPGKVFLITNEMKSSDKGVTAVLIDKTTNTITREVSGHISTRNIPRGCYMVGVIKGSNVTAEEFIRKQLKEGSVIRLRNNGNLTSLQEVLALGSPQIELDTDKYVTLANPDFSIKGQIKNFSSKKKYSVSVAGKPATVSAGNFQAEYKLLQGVNYIDVELFEEGKKIDKKEIVAFLKSAEQEDKRIVLWVEQFPNAKELTSQQKVDQMLLEAKKAGFNCVGFDVKGPEGYVSYRKNNLSKTPYFTATVNPNKKVEDDGFDLLQAMINGCRHQGLKIYVSFNFFTEGNITTQDYAVLKQHPEWEEVVQRPEDKGELIRISESKVGQEAKAGKRIALAFVNPSNTKVVDFQILRLQEVLANYDIDGIVLDRTRYDNLYADFSDMTRESFASYLQKKGKKLADFPQDAFLIDSEGKMIEGKYFIDWITFRSLTIRQFAEKVRQTVDAYNSKASKKVEMAAYVGSWYEVYYQNGVNWASQSFRYDPHLGFPESRIYTDEYSATSYTDMLDFLMIGTYYKTDKEIAKYVTLGNILTNGKVPLIASVSLPDLKNEDRPAVFRSAVQASSGLMIFDLCYIKWNEFLEQMKNIKDK